MAIFCSLRHPISTQQAAGWEFTIPGNHSEKAGETKAWWSSWKQLSFLTPVTSPVVLSCTCSFSPLTKPNQNIRKNIVLIISVNIHSPYTLPLFHGNKFKWLPCPAPAIRSPGSGLLCERGASADVCIIRRTLAAYNSVRQSNGHYAIIC